MKNAWQPMAIALFLSAGRAAAAADVTFTPLLNLRWRQEMLDTLSANRTLDHSYSFGNLRERFGADLQYKMITLHGLGQAADSYNVPNDGSFGAGANYFTASNRQSAPSHVDPAEFGVIIRPTPSIFLNMGRQGLKDGAEPPTGDARLDWVKDNRVSERLIGTWDWTNVGRRFDGASAGFNTEAFNISAFGARILQGGFDYPDAFKPLDDVKTAGLSATIKRDRWIPKTEVRFFDVAYRDARPIIQSALGERMYIDTLGADLVGVYPFGPGAFDALLWGAYQFGDYGSKHQSAGAVIFEVGYGLPRASWSPWFRAGVDYASGDSDPSDNTHGTFVNMAPTNHKFYGVQDLSAFQNLTDLFTQVMVQPVKPVKLGVEGHFYRLSNTADAWYAGSGPSNNSANGYTARAPASGQLGGHIGSEVDFIATWTLFKRLALQGALSHFEGASAAKTIYPVKSVANYAYVQAIFQY